MTGFVFFHVFLILLVWSVVITIVDLIGKNYETIGPILFLLSVIGLRCSYPAFVRVFSVLYGIVWAG
jgi:hypothetical protein